MQQCYIDYFISSKVLVSTEYNKGEDVGYVSDS